MVKDAVDQKQKRALVNRLNGRETVGPCVWGEVLKRKVNKVYVTLAEFRCVTSFLHSRIL